MSTTKVPMQCADDIAMFVGSVILRQEFDMLHAVGVKGIYGARTPIPVCAKDVFFNIQKA